MVAGSTRLKAGTAQKICLNIISTLLMTNLGKVKNGMMVNLIPNNKKLKERLIRIKSCQRSFKIKIVRIIIVGRFRSSNWGLF